MQHPTFTPALIQKAKILIKSNDWEQAAEIAQRVLTKDSANMEALMLTILYLEVRECRPSVTDSNLNDLVKAIDKNEPKNADLCYRVARTVARLSGKNAAALQKTLALVEKAHKLDPTRSDFLTELGYPSSPPPPRSQNALKSRCPLQGRRGQR